MKLNSKWAIGGVVFCTLLTSLGQLGWKLGVDSLVLTFVGLITNWPLIIGFIFYGIGSILLILCLKHGELSVLYPFLALSYIWVLLLSIFVLNETVSTINWVGVGSLLVGVSFIGRGAA